MKRSNEAGARPTRMAGPLFTRLARDTRGNALAIIAAALIPLTAMIGSGVDMSRAYMAKMRLQSACDAAALAGRRVMSNDVLDANVTAEANKFFNFNFPQRAYQTAAFTPVITKPDTGTVKVAVDTTIPTSIMSVFGFTSLPLAVECEASQNFINTDVLLVLDTTGSMLDTVDGDVKIVSLREAVMALYDELKPIQDELVSNNMRLRYGIVPYSSAVNVGGIIREVNSDYISNSWTYQTRTPIYSTSSPPVRVGTSMTNSQCNAYSQPRTPADSYPSVQKTVARPGSGTSRPCDVTTTTFTTDTTSNFAHWHHGPAVLDTSLYKTGSTSVLLPTRTLGTNTVTPAWTGCIEERDTDSSITSASGYTIPSGAWDLNINHIPDSDGTRWKPHWPQVIYERADGTDYETYASGADPSSGSRQFTRSGRTAYYACPSAAKRLTTWTRAEMETYVNNLVAIGGTYHDIGMIWGGRLISTAGIFRDDNPLTFNAMPVNRHIIFMTDGQLAPNRDSYSSYGVEEMDQRVTASSSASGQYSRHEQRFKMVCNSIKSQDVSVWVVAFDTAASAALNECASSTSQVSVSTNKAQLIAKFKEIGKNIGALRLTR